MAINWRLRGPVFRLLTAVYVELGEEAVGMAKVKSVSKG